MYRPEVSDLTRKQIIQIQGKLAARGIVLDKKGFIVETAVDLLLCVLDQSLDIQTPDAEFTAEETLEEVVKVVCYSVEKQIDFQ